VSFTNLLFAEKENIGFNVTLCISFLPLPPDGNYIAFAPFSENHGARNIDPQPDPPRNGNLDGKENRHSALRVDVSDRDQK
jgi:hypothetical protein